MSMLLPPPPDHSSSWPPNYAAHLEWRFRTLEALLDDGQLLADAKDHYAGAPLEFIEHWCDTYDPRNAGTGKPTWMPFIPFSRQREYVEFIDLCRRGEASGLTEKSRDMGATWGAVLYSDWMWLFLVGSQTGWGSVKADKVDKLGDMSSIFEKVRQSIVRLPPCFLPAGFRPSVHMGENKVINPENGSAIIGEVGDNIGRGGRTTMYFKDESAHYVRPENIEAALSDTTRVQFDISSVCHGGHLFRARREGGVDWETGRDVTRGRTNVFVMDWSDHPEKNQAWYDQRYEEAGRNGIITQFKQEVDRDYDASADGIVVPSEHVRSAIDAHLKIEGMEEGPWVAGLDVADGMVSEGADLNALVARKGWVIKIAQQWGERDTGVTTRKTVQMLHDKTPVNVNYDSVAVGAGVKAEVNRLIDDEKLPAGIKFVAWNGGAKVLYPEKRVVALDRSSPLNKDFYANLKAQGWWETRLRFERTHRAITQGEKFRPDELISIDSSIPLLRQLCKEISQPTAGTNTTMKLLINKKPKGSRSPNLGDGAMMCVWPVRGSYDSSLAWVGV